MATKILIERKIQRDSLGKMLELSLELRSLAVRQSGYISGETLISAEQDNEYLVVSTWRNQDDWRQWEKHPERQAIVEKMQGLLTEPARVRVFIDLWGSAGP